MEVDLGIDWRRDDPVILDIGPVLSLDDAVGNKIAALYSRGEPRDYLDVDAIRRSRRFTDQQLLAAAAERDRGFDPTIFAQQLDAARRITPVDVVPYGIDAATLHGVVERCTAWADQLRTDPSADS